MKSHPVRLIALLVALAPLAAAQTGGTTPARPESKPQTAPEANPAKPAASDALPTVPVTGLTAENAAKVESALKAHTSTVYKCEHCDRTSMEAGMCCEKPTKAVTGPALRTAKADPASSTVSFALAPGQAVRLSEIEKLLKADGVTVKRDQVKLGNEATIAVAGVADQAAADSVRKAINDAKLFDQIDVKTASNKREAQIVIRKAGASGATEARVKEALAKANPGFTVSDVIWASPSES